ncbi:MAG: hypothetical protein SWK76_06100 [Actinomycetota bacterium]|nr:hypothetical protein [Actinomycetota bacterium]
MRARTCGRCGVPMRVVREHKWLDDGTITQAKNPDHRMVFIESENINSTFSNIEEIIGLSIERMVIEAKRRAAFDFIDHMLPGIVKAVVRMIGLRPVIRNVASLGRVMGYGDLTLVDLRRMHDQGDHATLLIREPYSLPLFCGDLAGTFEAIDRRDVGVEYEKVSSDSYRITGVISKHPLELRERLQTRTYSHKPGGIAYKTCPSCGGPEDLSQYGWDLERGVVMDKIYDRRMALLGPAALEAVIDDLEEELGDTIPRVIIEAQRRFVKTGFYTLEEVSSLEKFRAALAIRGMGNLREMDWNEKGLKIRIENPCLYQVLVGLVQGFLELASGREARVDWELVEDNDLSVEVALVN